MRVAKRALSTVCVGLLLLIPSKVFSSDCWLGSLTVKVYEEGQHQYRKTNGETSESSRKVTAEGKVLFSSGRGRLKIYHKNLWGKATSTSFRDSRCTHYEGNMEGFLQEGVMKSKKIDTAHWVYTIRGRTQLKAVKGCMQDPIPPIDDTIEEEDFRFEGIVRPGMYKLEALCNEVKGNSGLGYCQESLAGFFGKKVQSVSNAQVTAITEYEWKAERVVCDDCQINKLICERKAAVDLEDCQLTGCAACNLMEKLSAMKECMETCKETCVQTYGNDLNRCREIYNTCRKP